MSHEALSDGAFGDRATTMEAIIISHGALSERAFGLPWVGRAAIVFRVADIVMAYIVMARMIMAYGLGGWRSCSAWPI